MEPKPKRLGFELDPKGVKYSFTPHYYPSDFTQMKKRELNRYGGGCDGESVSIKSTKNMEFHVTGKLLEGEIRTFNVMVGRDPKVDLISPKTPGKSGMECFIKKGELGKQAGWDPQRQQWLFEYTLDLVSTGRDEREGGKNAIVSSNIGNANCTYKGKPRTAYSYTGETPRFFKQWQSCELSTEEFVNKTPQGEGLAAVELD